jgi:glyoxylase-like metal-dependent hydrolase (beta-lactamase superfamily II)
MNWTKPVEIAPDVFWVGYVIPNDPFQCHVYLIKNGDESILIDPGSMITFPIVLEKITSIVPLHQIKYIIMHHQDPDIVGCFATLEKIMPNQEKYIVTHWRSQMLLKHYMWKTPFWLVDKNNWKLKAGDRELEFVFTPYAHFAGAFCTYDKKSGVLFSSDLFGGLTDEVRLFARDIGYFDNMKPFHQHYMPSKEVLRYAVSEINKKEPAMIAPQHGFIIRKNLIKPISDKLMDLDCGLYMLDEYESDIMTLSKADDIIKHFCKALASNLEFVDVLKKLFADIKEKSDSIKRIVICGDFGEKRICFYVNSRCRIKITDENEKFNSVFSQDLIYEGKLVGRVHVEAKDDSDVKIYKLLFDKITDLLTVRLEKDMELKVLEEQNKKLYE